MGSEDRAASIKSTGLGRSRFHDRGAFAEARRHVQVHTPLYLTAKGPWNGRPNGTPLLTVCTGRMKALPSRLLFRVSTNETGPSTDSRIVTSTGAPTCNVPSFGTR